MSGTNNMVLLTNRQRRSHRTTSHAGHYFVRARAIRSEAPARTDARTVSTNARAISTEARAQTDARAINTDARARTEARAIRMEVCARTDARAIRTEARAISTVARARSGTRARADTRAPTDGRAARQTRLPSVSRFLPTIRRVAVTADSAPRLTATLTMSGVQPVVRNTARFARLPLMAHLSPLLHSRPSSRTLLRSTYGVTMNNLLI